MSENEVQSVATTKSEHEFDAQSISNWEFSFQTINTIVK